MRAEEYFEHVREIAIQRDKCACALSELAASDGLSAQSYETIGGGNTDMGDKVISGMSRREALEAKIRDYDKVLDDATAILYGDGSWKGLWKIYGGLSVDIVNAHYVEVESWREIAEEATDRTQDKKTREWCRYKASQLFDFIDRHAPMLVNR